MYVWTVQQNNVCNGIAAEYQTKRCYLLVTTIYTISIYFYNDFNLGELLST